MNDNAKPLDCICGHPDYPGVVHRTIGPCYLTDKPTVEDDFELPAKACDMGRPEGCESCQ